MRSFVKSLTEEKGPYGPEHLDAPSHSATGPDERFWGLRGAGILVRAESTGKYLLGLRSGSVNEPNTWSLFGGKIDDDEDPEQAARRELVEETGYRGPIKTSPLTVYENGKTFKFFNFLGSVPEEFEPKLSWETDDFGWFALKDFPTPLHFGVKSLIAWGDLREHQSGLHPFLSTVTESEQSTMVACNGQGLYMARDHHGEVTWELDPARAEQFTEWSLKGSKARIRDMAGCHITFETL
jgi:8-oxo-dGTP pyrophosphatase MutT (NUDIX family)